MFIVSTRNFPPDLGGMQNLMGGLSEALQKHGPVKVFADAYKDSEEYDKKINLNITRVSGFKFLRKYRKANLIKDFSAKNSIRAFFFDHWKSIEKIDDKILNNTPSFCLIHSKEINHSEGSLINKRMLKALNKATYVISNSEFTKKLAIKNGLNEKKIQIIHPGCNYPIKIDSKNIDKAKELYRNCFPKIITVARLDKRKSHQNILMTIKNLLPMFPKLKYISIGDGDEKNNLESLRKSLNLEDRVNFIYKSSEQEKLALLENSSLFIMPSVIHKKSVEGFGIAFIEAASYGKPSIGGKFGGEADAIIEDETGYLCDGNDLNSIYETLTKTLKDDKYKKLGSNAFEFSRKFNWNKIIKKYIELI